MRRRDDHLSPKKGTTPNLLFAGAAGDTPPGYEETISRQRLLKNYNRQVETPPCVPLSSH